MNLLHKLITRFLVHPVPDRNSVLIQEMRDRAIESNNQDLATVQASMQAFTSRTIKRINRNIGEIGL